MAKPTKQNVALSAFLGGKLSPSQLTRLTTTEGLGLPPGVAWADYGPVLATLTGRGRDLDVASVRIAAEHGWYTERLRAVLAAPADDKRDQIFMETAEQLLAKAALVKANMGTIAGPPEEEAEVIAKVAAEDIKELYEHPEDAYTEDLYDLARITTEERQPPATDRMVYEDEFTSWIKESLGHVAGREEWAKTAPAEELVQAVQTAKFVWDFNKASDLGFGEEDSWRLIAGLAPAASVFVNLITDIASQVASSRTEAQDLLASFNLSSGISAVLDEPF